MQQSLGSVLEPVERARGLPNAHYLSEDVYLRERDSLLFSTWAGIALGSDVPNSGDVYPVDFIGMPLMVVRDHDGAVRVFQNTCRHRGMILVEEKKNLRGTIRCPYHSWCYGLDGRLRATPHVGGPGMNYDRNVDREQFGLIPIRSHVWRDVVFVNIDGRAPTFEDHASQLIKRWADHDETELIHGGRDSSFTFDASCNWKLAVENYCESYHLPWVHPGLNSYSRLEDHYHIEQPGSFSGQGTVVYRQIKGQENEVFPDFGGLSDFWNRGAEYVALFPNVLFGVHRDHAYAILLLPQGVDRTLERVEIYYSFDVESRPKLKELVGKNAEQWYGVLDEDIFVVEGMQRGRHGIYFDGGKFAPVMDSPTHLFHAWVAEKYSADSQLLAAE